MPEYPHVVVQGQTSAGVTVKLVQHGPSPRNVTLEVGDVLLDVLWYEHYRDGGTRVYQTEAGVLRLPRRVRDPDRRPRWRGEVVYEESHGES